MARFLLLSLFLLPFLPAGADAQTPPRNYNTTLFGTLNPDPPTGGGERYSALTGYVAPNGREYALLGGFTGTYIIDVTEAPIKQVAYIPGPHSGWREMKTYKNYGYVVSEGGAGLQIIDLSQLPTKATLVKSDTSRFVTAHTVTQEGKYLYVNGTGASAGVNGGTLILDLTNPVKPVSVGVWTDRYVHDCVIRNDTLYASAINNGQLDIVYLGANRQNPTFVTAIQYPGAGTHNSDLTPDGSYIMTTDEIGATPKTLKVWDRRDIGNIAKVADYTPVPGQIIHNLHMKGTTAYVAWYAAGTRIIDMTNPLQPAEVGYFDTYPGSEENYVGNWGVYPYLPSGKIISSDMLSGLYVFTFNGAKRGSVRGVVRDSATGTPIANAVIAIAKFGRTITTDAQGRYSYAGAVDSLAFTAAAVDHRGVAGTLALTEAGTDQDILLPQLQLTQFTLSAIDAETKTPLNAFAYRIMERPANDGRTTSPTLALAVPTDSLYHIYVGAWGHRSRSVEITNPSGVITVPLNPGYMDDAELDFGWSFTDAADNALGGIWERGVPVETGYNGGVVQPGADNTPGVADHAFLTGIQNSSGGAGNNDVDNGLTTLTSPPMDLRSYKNPIITCSIWYSRDARTDATNDTLVVQLSNDGGANWQTVERITASPKVWTPHRYRLRDYFVSGGERTMFRMIASDYDPQSLVEAGLDDFDVADSGRQAFDVPVGPRAGVVAGARVVPNPVNAQAWLELNVSDRVADARLALFDMSGRLVRTFDAGSLEPGAHRIAIDAHGLASGRYTWRLSLADGTALSGALSVVR